MHFLSRASCKGGENFSYSVIIPRIRFASQLGIVRVLAEKM